MKLRSLLLLLVLDQAVTWSGDDTMEVRELIDNISFKLEKLSTKCELKIKEVFNLQMQVDLLKKEKTALDHENKYSFEQVNELNTFKNKHLESKGSDFQLLANEKQSEKELKAIKEEIFIINVLLKQLELHRPILKTEGNHEFCDISFGLAPIFVSLFVIVLVAIFSLQDFFYKRYPSKDSPGAPMIIKSKLLNYCKDDTKRVIKKDGWLSSDEDELHDNIKTMNRDINLDDNEGEKEFNEPLRDSESHIMESKTPVNPGQDQDLRMWYVDRELVITSIQTPSSIIEQGASSVTVKVTHAKVSLQYDILRDLRKEKDNAQQGRDLSLLLLWLLGPSEI